MWLRHFVKVFRLGFARPFTIVLSQRILNAFEVHLEAAKKQSAPKRILESTQHSLECAVSKCCSRGKCGWRGETSRFRRSHPLAMGTELNISRRKIQADAALRRTEK